MFIDSLNREQAFRLIFFIEKGTRNAAKALFPDRPKGYVKATEMLLEYAWYKVAERNSDLLLETRKEYAGKCADVWCRMPAYARYVDWRVVG